MNKILLFIAVLLLAIGCQKPEKEVVYTINYQIDGINRDITYTKISYYYNGQPHIIQQFGTKSIDVVFYTCDPYIKFNMDVSHPSEEITGDIYITASVNGNVFWCNDGNTGILTTTPQSNRNWFFEWVLD